MLKFKTNRDDLIKALSALSRVMPKSSINPILNNVYISKLSDDKIRLFATDLNRVMQYDIEARNIEGDGILYDLNKLFSIVNNLNDEILIDNGNIKANNSKFKIQFANANEYPKCENYFDFSDAVDINLTELKKAIMNVNYATAKLDNTCLSGIYINKGDFVATDGNRMAIYKTQIDLPNAIIKHDTAEDILKAFAGDSVRVCIKNNKIYLTNNEVSLASQLLSGKYPTYEALLPKSFAQKIEIDKTDFIKGLELLNPVLDDKKKLVKLIIGGDNINISVVSDCNEGDTDITIKTFVDESITIAFNAVYLQELLKTCDSVVTMGYNSSLGAVVFESGNIYALVMPVQLKN